MKKQIEVQEDAYVAVNDLAMIGVARNALQSMITIEKAKSMSSELSEIESEIRQSVYLLVNEGE